RSPSTLSLHDALPISAVVIALASLLVAPIRPATVMTSLVVGGISAIAAAWLSARLAGSMRTKTTRYGSRNGDWRTASCKRAGCRSEEHTSELQSRGHL